QIALKVFTTNPFIAFQPVDIAEPICLPFVINHCLVASHAVPSAVVSTLHRVPGSVLIKVFHPCLILDHMLPPLVMNHCLVAAHLAPNHVVNEFHKSPVV